MTRQQTCLRCGLPLEVAFKEDAIAIGCAKCDRAMLIPVRLNEADFRIFGMEKPGQWRWQDDPGVWQLAAQHYNDKIREEFPEVEEGEPHESV